MGASSSGLGSTMPSRVLARVQNYISVARPPAYPFAVDETAAQQGRAVFDGACAACHASGGSRTGTVIPIAELGTDRHRLDAWTADDANALNAFGDGRDWKFSAFRKIRRLCRGSARRRVAARALSSQRIRAVAGRPPRAARAPSARVLARIRRVRSRERGIRVVGIGGAAGSGPCTTCPSPATATPAIVYGTELPAESKRVLLEFLKTQ